MFLQFLHDRNPALIDYAATLLKSGRIEPDSYVLDLDAIEANADRLLRAAADSGVSLYFMSKQIGRNPEVARRVLSRRITITDDRTNGSRPIGFAGMVAVDFREALSLHAAGLPVKHLGHLVQIPESFLDTALDMKPEVITVYSLEKAEALARRARASGRLQDVLLRVVGENDIAYAGQEGGTRLEKLIETVQAIGRLKGIRFAGITAFPCFLYDDSAGKAVTTPNAYTVERAVALLREQLGLVCRHVNMPSCNSPATIPIIAAMGGTHAEPGHSLTGTNPDNLGDPDPLAPALAYVTEVSHRYGGDSLCFGGGHYRRSNVRNALVATSSGYEPAFVMTPECEAIDYHLSLRGPFPIGAPVLMSFRTQIFVTRSRVVLVEGLSAGKPAVAGTWDAQGRHISHGGLL
jgi:predicted amino acid racemase